MKSVYHQRSKVIYLLIPLLKKKCIHQEGAFLSILSSNSRREKIEKEASTQVSIFMTSPISVKMYFCKERNKLVGASNFITWKKRANLNIIENEVMDHIKGSKTLPSKEDTQAHAKYMKGEVRSQRILIESIKDSLIPYVSKL